MRQSRATWSVACVPESRFVQFDIHYAFSHILEEHLIDKNIRFCAVTEFSICVSASSFSFPIFIFNSLVFAYSSNCKHQLLFIISLQNKTTNLSCSFYTHRGKTVSTTMMTACWIRVQKPFHVWMASTRSPACLLLQMMFPWRLLWRISPQPWAH